jgi:hypothetical protein
MSCIIISEFSTGLWIPDVDNIIYKFSNDDATVYVTNRPRCALVPIMDGVYIGPKAELMSRSRVLLNKSTVAQMVKKFLEGSFTKPYPEPANQVYNLIHYFFNINFNIILPLMPKSQNLAIQGFLAKTLYALFIAPPPQYATSPRHNLPIIRIYRTHLSVRPQKNKR